MRGIDSRLSLLGKDGLKKIFAASLEILESTGMKIGHPGLLDALESSGAAVNRETSVVRFPPDLLEATVKRVASDYPPPPSQQQTILSKPCFEIGGGPALYFLDYDNQEIRRGTAQDALFLAQLGDALDDVHAVSSTVVDFSTDLNGRPFAPQLYTVKSMALTAKHTAKISYAENIHTVPEMKILIEMARVLNEGVEGRTEADLVSFCKPVISPLKLEGDDAAVLHYLASQGLPCSIASMPIAGATSPVTLAGTIALAHAELLGGWAAVKAINGDVKCGYVFFCGAMDMRKGIMTYGAPEALQANIGLGELVRHYYRIPPKLETLYIDGKLPGTQPGIERAIGYLCGAAFGMKSIGRSSLGNLSQAQVISPEQILIDIETGKWVQRFIEGFEVNAQTLAVDAVMEVGIGGNYMAHPHTLNHFKGACWVPELFDRDRAEDANWSAYSRKDMMKRAHKKIKAVMRDYRPFKLDKAKSARLDEIVKRAEQELTGG